jgi:hypothetical protein
MEGEGLGDSNIPVTEDESESNGMVKGEEVTFDSASVLFIGHLFLIIDIFCTSAFLAGLYGNKWYRFVYTLVCNLYK